MTITYNAGNKLPFNFPCRTIKSFLLRFEKEHLIDITTGELNNDTLVIKNEPRKRHSTSAQCFKLIIHNVKRIKTVVSKKGLENGNSRYSHP